MVTRLAKTRAIILLLILIAIGGVVLYGKDKVSYKVESPIYANPR